MVLTGYTHLNGNKSPSHCENPLSCFLRSKCVLDPEDEVDPVSSDGDKREDRGAFVKTTLPDRKVIDVVFSIYSFDQANWLSRNLSIVLLFATDRTRRLFRY